LRKENRYAVLHNSDDFFGLFAGGFRNYGYRVQFDEFDAQSGATVDGNNPGYR